MDGNFYRSAKIQPNYQVSINLQHLFVFLHKQLLNVTSFTQQITCGSVLILFCGPVDWTNLYIKWQLITEKLSKLNRSNCLKNVDMLDWPCHFWPQPQPKLRIFIVQVNIAKLILQAKVFCIFKKTDYANVCRFFLCLSKIGKLDVFSLHLPFPSGG